MRTTKRAAAFSSLLVAFVLFGPAAGRGAENPAAVEVRLTEYAIEMPTTLPPGPTVFHVRNDGRKSHSLKIQGPGIDETLEAIVRPKETGTLQVVLVPGEYKVFCPIGSHASKGMPMTLVVKDK